MFFPIQEAGRIKCPNPSFSFSKGPVSLSCSLGFCTAGPCTTDTFFRDYFILCVWLFAHMHVYVPCVYLVPIETRRGCFFPWNWSYRHLEAAFWMLGTEPRSSLRVARALTHWTITAAPSYRFLTFISAPLLRYSPSLPLFVIYVIF